MKRKIAICVYNPGEAPEHNGQTIHALKLAKGLHQGGAQVELLFCGKAVTWLPRFANRDEDSHPFIKHYGPVFDEVRALIKSCNMCCTRFDSREAIAAADIPILGEGKEHVDLASFVLDGYEVINS